MISFFEKDPYSPIQYVYEVTKILYSGKSEFQQIVVIENPYFGRMLVLDGVVQLTDKDEFFYHEMLTHVVMHAHPAPGKVVVIGGGDGGVVREVMKHNSVEKTYFIEIDEEVIKTSERFFPSVSSEIKNPKVEVICMDGAEFIRNRSEDIDVIIVDSTDIIGFAKSLFTIDFFKSVKDALGDDGMFVTLSESLHFHKDIVLEIQETLKMVFPIVDLYTAPIATYAGNWWAFSVASMRYDPREMQKNFTIDTRYYSEEIHRNAFLPPGLYRKLMNKELDW
ncbi:spermidine synthase [bacterium BMS3Abin07]|nr:spermidine synthase [bacterium BMS3Abin07]HDO21269.1 polyamine aminopropyltransferase [Nitrospirota bacterium]HDZ88536.1 polyamine aminopropyltransferase [Nitrospirota bacterium]